MIRPLALAAALALAACSAPAHQPDVRICAPNPGMRSLVAQAAERWEAAAGLWIVVDGTCSRPDEIRAQYRDVSPQWGAAWPDLCAVDPDAPPRYHGWIKAHELGHVLARSGEHTPTGIMAPTTSTSVDRITAADLALVCAAAPCRAFAAEQDAP